MGAFWNKYQPGFRATSTEPGSERFFREVEEARYSLEPHIPEVVGFERWADADVLEVGCGVGTDGAQFARAGARYTGVDRSRVAIDLATRRFELEKLDAELQQIASAAELPFADNTFDLVYSHGVLHHMPEPDMHNAIREIGRVLKPGGEVLVMLYHRGSVNYHVTIMFVRRLLVSALLLPGASAVIARATRERKEVTDGHRELLRARGIRGYPLDRALFLSNNTDGPGNPISRVYSRREAIELVTTLAELTNVTTEVRYLNLRLYPGGSRLTHSRLGHRLERRYGWHLYVRGRKRNPQ